MELSNQTTLSISSETLSTLERISAFCLPKEYELSLVLCGNALSQELNRVHREKDYPTNILSFPLSEMSGEIFIDLEKAREECKEFDREFENFVVFLFIHGIAHLIGYEHGSRMENYEADIQKEFGI